MELPEVRKTVFLYICSFLNELLKHQKDNKLDVTTLGTIKKTSVISHLDKLIIVWTILFKLKEFVKIT